MLWLKAFHLIAMVTWFAGLFYLPRLFVYHCEATDAAGHARFCRMERRLFVIMTVGAALTVLLGLLLITGAGAIPSRLHLLEATWLQAKLAFAGGLLLFHGWLWLLHRGFAGFRNRHPARFYRLINEVPVLFLVAMVLLAVLKPGG